MGRGGKEAGKALLKVLQGNTECNIRKAGLGLFLVAFSLATASSHAEDVKRGGTRSLSI